MAKYAAFGTQLQMGDGGGPETFATIINLQSLSGPALSTDSVDVTAHDSPGGYEEFVMTILRSGSISFKILYDPPAATHNKTTGLLKKYQSKTKTNFKLVLTDVGLSTWTFSGYVQQFNLVTNYDGALEGDCQIKVSGQVTPV